MKLTITTALAALFATPLLAWSFPAHERDGYRDTGCDFAAQKTVTNAAGDVLYYTNNTCPAGSGPTDAAPAPVAVAVAPVPPVRPIRPVRPVRPRR